MGSIGELPPKDSADIYLDFLTPEEQQAQSAANSVEWSGALNQEQYFRREAHLSNQDFTRDGRLTEWGLIYQPSGTEGRQVLAGCETYRKKGLIKNKDGKIQEGVIHGVGSVFSHPEYRGKGYGGRMMKDLGERLKSWQAEYGGKEEVVIGSVLFSDIGKKFYAKSGWQAFPSAHVSLPPKDTASTSSLPEVRSLKAEDLPDLCELDEKLVRERMAKQKDDKPAVALLPDAATIKWHHAREEFVANELYGKQPLIKGAVAGKQGERVWCYWTRVFTNPEKEPPVLHILRLVIEDTSFDDFKAADPALPASQLQQLGHSATSQAIAACFAAAQAQAKEWGMQEVMMWNPTSTSLAAARLLEEGAEVVQREEESIACLLWYGEGAWEEVRWVENEKFGWC